MADVFRPHATGPKLSSHREMRGGKWERMRRRWLMRYPSCARCGMAGEEVHHIAPRSVAPERAYDWTNLLTLCRRCHRLEHGQLSTSYPQKLSTSYPQKQAQKAPEGGGRI